MKSRKLPIILVGIIIAWILVTVGCMFVDQNFTMEYIFQGIILGISTDAVILFGIASFSNMKNILAAKNQDSIKNNNKKKGKELLKLLLVLIIISLFLSCLLLTIGKGEFTLVNISMITLFITISLMILIGVIGILIEVLNLRKEYGIGVVLLVVIITALMIFIKYRN